MPVDVESPRDKRESRMSILIVTFSKSLETVF